MNKQECASQPERGLYAAKPSQPLGPVIRAGLTLTLGSEVQLCNPSHQVQPSLMALAVGVLRPAAAAAAAAAVTPTLIKRRKM